MIKHATVALIGSALLASAASAGTLKVQDPGNTRRQSNGGEFRAVPQTGFLGLTGLASDETASSFATFCIELNETINLGNTVYNGVINTAAVAGGKGGGNPDPIGAETAFLYTNFRYGTLANFQYTPGSQRAADARSLQLAFWWLENELDSSSAERTEYLGNTAIGIKARAYVASAQSAVLGGQWSGIGQVRALNVTTSAGALRQDLLTIVAIPLPSAAGLGTAGLFGILAIRRRISL